MLQYRRTNLITRGLRERDNARRIAWYQHDGNAVLSDFSSWCRLLEPFCYSCFQPQDEAGVSEGPHQSAAPIPTLPQELLDEIIDHLAFDAAQGPDMRTGRYTYRSETLAACSLTAQAWVPRSSMYLLSRAKIRTEEDAQCFLQEAESSSRLSLNVKLLVYRQRRDQPLDIEWVRSVLTQLESLAELSIYSVMTHSDSISADLYVQHKVRTIHLEHMPVAAFTAVHKLLPSLDELC